jgi:hypothetical protein
MKVVGLNGYEYNLNLKKYLNRRSKCSNYHLLVRDLIKDIFSGYNIYEEVKLPGSVDPSKKSVLYLDFFIPNVNIAIEIHGEQHFKYIPFFHKTKAGFLQHKARDQKKAQWCEINNITLIELRWDESIDFWRQKIERSR